MNLLGSWTSRVSSEDRILREFRQAAAGMLATMDGPPDASRLKAPRREVNNLSIDFPHLSEEWEKCFHDINDPRRIRVAGDGRKTDLLAEGRVSFLTDGVYDVATDPDLEGSFKGFHRGELEAQWQKLRDWSEKIYKQPELMRDPEEMRQVVRDFSHCSTTMREANRLYRMLETDLEPGWTAGPAYVSPPAAAWAQWMRKEMQIMLDSVDKMLDCCHKMNALHHVQPSTQRTAHVRSSRP